MQPVVLDGVRRTSVSGNRPQALVLGTRRERPTPLSPSQSRAVTSMDGLRRNAPTPRQLLDQVVPVEPILAPLIPQVAPVAPTRSRPMIGFSILASALIVAGVTGSKFIPAKASTESSSRIVAPQAATPAPTIASTPAPTPAPTPPAKAAAAVPSYSSVQQILDTFVGAHGSQYTIYVKDLKTGQVSSVNADKVMRSASLYKLFVAQRIYQMIDSGELTYGQKAGAESGRTIESCLTVMINVSDNACGHDLGTLVGWNKQDANLHAAGFTSTTLGDRVSNAQLTNAKDVGLLMERLYAGTSMSPNATQRFTSLLKDQRVNDRFPKGLPSRTVIAHKTGDLMGYVHDAGIVYGKNTDFVVVVMSGPWGSPESSKPAFGTLAGQLNSYLNR
jgi:beta-lactamase class A